MDLLAPPFTTDPFRVAGWLIEPLRLRVSRGDAAHLLEPKVMQVLVVLAHHAGDPVTRDLLMDTVWAGTVVTDDVLTRAVSELRKLFGDDPRRPHLIETIPKIGYRLIAPVEPVPLAATPPPAPALPPPPAAMPRWVWPLAASLGAVLLVALFAWQAVPRQPPAPLLAQPLTTLPGSESGVALSPDGTQFVFAHRVDTTTNLFVRSWAGGPLRQLTDDPGIERGAVWSGDGQEIAFVRRTRTTCAVFVVPALGGPERQVAACNPVGFPGLDWSADGQWFALAERPDSASAAQVFLIDAATGTRTPFTDPPGTLGDAQPRFSPDGQRLAFLRRHGHGAQDLFTKPLSGGVAQPWTDLSLPFAGFDWSADGTYLVFSVNHVGTFRLWASAGRASEPAWLGLSEEAYRPVLARHTDRLVFERWQVESNVYQYALSDSTAPTPLIRSTRMDLYPTFSPDGKRVVFTSNRGGRYELWQADADGANPVPLTQAGFSYAAMPRFSPDGQRLAFVGYPGAQGRIYVLDRPNTAPRALTEAGSDASAPAWSVDGRWLYFGSNRSGTWQLWRQPVGGGAAEPMTTDGGYAAQADGQWLYFTRFRTDGLWRKPLTGGPAEPVLPSLSRTSTHNWVIQDDAILYLERISPNMARLARLDRATRHTTPLRTLDRSPEDFGLALTPDGQHAVLVQIDRAAADLMYAEGVIARLAE